MTKVPAPQAVAKLTPLKCAKAIEHWMIVTWRLMPCAIDVRGADNRAWIEFRGFVRYPQEPGATPDDTVFRVLLPGRHSGEIDKPLPQTVLVCRLYQTDPTPRRAAYTAAGLSVQSINVPSLPEPIAIFGTADGVIVADCIVASEDFGGDVIWPFDD